MKLWKKNSMYGKGLMKAIQIKNGMITKKQQNKLRNSIRKAMRLFERNVAKNDGKKTKEPIFSNMLTQD